MQQDLQDVSTSKCLFFPLSVAGEERFLKLFPSPMNVSNLENILLKSYHNEVLRRCW